MMLKEKLRETRNPLRTREDIEMSKQISKEFRGVVYPLEMFLVSEMDFMFTVHALSKLSCAIRL